RGLVLEGGGDRAGGGVVGGAQAGGGLADRDRLVFAAGGGGGVVGVAGVGGDPVVGAGFGAGAGGRRVVAVGAHRHGAVGGHHAAFGGLAFLVVVELPADLPARFGAEQAGDRGLVLEGGADRAGGRVLGGAQAGGGLADRDRLVFAAGGGGGVVGVAGVGGDPVVGAGFASPARRSSELAVGAHRHGAVGGHHAAFGGLAFLVVVELPADLPARFGAEQAGDRGLVLEGGADRAGGRVLGGAQAGGGLADRDRLVFAAGGGGGVVGVAGVGGDPVVGAGFGAGA